VTAEPALRVTNRNLIVFDAVLGSAAILAPASLSLTAAGPGGRALTGRR
jgi:hypothetical protein